jgi:hypothetical protein
VTEAKLIKNMRISILIYGVLSHANVNHLNLFSPFDDINGELILRKKGNIFPPFSFLID